MINCKTHTEDIVNIPFVSLLYKTSWLHVVLLLLSNSSLTIAKCCFFVLTPLCTATWNQFVLIDSSLLKYSTPVILLLCHDQNLMVLMKTQFDLLVEVLPPEFGLTLGTGFNLALGPTSNGILQGIWHTQSVNKTLFSTNVNTA